MKRIFYSILAAVTIVLAACGGDQNEPAFDENGALKGVFSVDANGKKVQFSKGNLQYHCLDKTWQFAANQWDVIGKENNEKIADDFDGWIDLFGWGTGNKPTEISVEAADYKQFTDWGNNAISNGGKTPNYWHTLEALEWKYLIIERTDAEKLVGVGTIDDVFGLILLPDDWNEAAHPEFKATGKLIWNQGVQKYENEQKSDFLVNSYNAQQWGLTMEKDGAVFLPAGGWRAGSSVNHVNAIGCYWSVSAFSALSGYSGRAQFNKNGISPNGNSSSCNGYSVRLVQDVK